MQNQPITIYDDGSQSRSFCYVDNLIEAFVRLMETDGDFLGPVNLGDPVEFTIRELAEKVVEMTGSKSILDFRPLPADDPMQRKPDITLAREKMGWDPDIQLQGGLVKTIEYFRGLLKTGHENYVP